MELILIRHATTQGNLEKRFIGTTDLPITGDGAAQARLVAPSLPAVEHIYRSPLLRCRQTAELLWPDVAHTAISQLRETDFGPFEGKNHEELKDDPLYQAWIDEKADLTRIPVGETAQQVAARAAEGVRILVADAAHHDYNRVGVVIHGGTMMGILHSFAPPSEDYYTWLAGNCSGYWTKVCENPLSLEILQTVGPGKIKSPF